MAHFDFFVSMQLKFNEDAQQIKLENVEDTTAFRVLTNENFFQLSLNS